MASNAFSEKSLERLRARAVDLLTAALPPEVQSMKNKLPGEIADRVVACAKLVGRSRGGQALRDQILIVLADYRNHDWTSKRLRDEKTRINLADMILKTRKKS